MEIDDDHDDGSWTRKWKGTMDMDYVMDCTMIPDHVWTCDDLAHKRIAWLDTNLLHGSF